MTTRAEGLIEQALTDPRRVLDAGESILDELAPTDYQERSEVYRAMSMAARHVDEIDRSIDLARDSAAIALEGGLEEQRLMGLLTMSGSLAIAGRIRESLRVIEEGIAEAEDPHLRARFVFQRGAVNYASGHLSEAVDAYLTALPIFREAGDGFSTGLTLNRLGQAYTEMGRVSEAEPFLVEALELAEEREEFAAAHGIMHNIGMLYSYRGDIPEALDWLERSDALFLEVSGRDFPQHVARAEVLISAGRFEEALASASQIAHGAAVQNDLEHEGEARLVAARAALAAGQYAVAVEQGEAAVELFAGASMSARRDETSVLLVEARMALDGASSELLAQVQELLHRLEGEGLVVASVHARFLAARIALDIDLVDEAQGLLESLAELRTGPIEVRLVAASARARLAMINGDRAAALRAVRSGLTLIDRYQQTLGATDLRLGIERHGTELSEMGLGLALDGGRPRRVLEWLDRTRARSLRVRQVTSSTNDEVVSQLADLRRVAAELRNPANRGNRELERRRRALESRIAKTERVRRLEGQDIEQPSVDLMISELGDTALFELGVVDGQLLAVFVRDSRAFVVEMGGIGGVLSELEHLRFAMRRAARRGRALGSSELESLDHRLFGEIDLGDQPLLVVPTPNLMSLPWAALPSLQGRDLTISPSAEMWWRSLHGQDQGSGVVVAGGPDLEIADREVAQVGEIYPDARVLPAGASVEEVRAGIDGARIAHIACHAQFSVENPMFSSLRLSDGDLYVYDIERLDAAPGRVVLSACDSGYTDANSGEELAGLTSALLSMGTRTVVASIGLVPDTPATSDLMVDFHRGLVAGLEPAAALSRAQEECWDDPERFISAASFLCIGA